MLKISISGVRGIVGKSFEKTAEDFAKAYGTYVKGGKVVVGRDTRSHGKLLQKIIFKGLKSAGCKIIDLGIAPTPTVGIMVKKLKARGGIVITASHNPPQWNGMKFFSPDGLFLTEEKFKKFENFFHSKRFAKKPGGSVSTFSRPFDFHISKVLSAVDTKKIVKRSFKVVIDSCNGAGSAITPQLLKKLGCEVIEINTKTNAPFPHGPEPTPENLSGLCRAVLKNKADVGFAQDPDADRLSIVTNSGKAISEEYTVALASFEVLSKYRKGQKTAVNLSTSSLMDAVAKKFGAKLFRTKIGEIHVSSLMKKIKAVIGGEGNGGVIFPEVGYNRDSLAGIGLVLNLLADQGKTVDGIVSSLPRYFLCKDKIECRTVEEAKMLLKKVETIYQKEKIDKTEGIKVLFKNAWLHVRASNTEPIVRVFCEAKDKMIAVGIIHELSLLLHR